MTTEEADGIVNHVSSGLFWLWKGSMQNKYYFFTMFERAKHKAGMECKTHGTREGVGRITYTPRSLLTPLRWPVKRKTTNAWSVG